MVDDDIAKQYLTQFDTLDLSEKDQRRMGVYVLKEFYAAVMSEVGRECLDMEDGVKRAALDGMWSKTLTRLESLDDLEKPSESGKIIHQLKQFRNNTHHNTDFNPGKSPLEEARSLAPYWREWLIKKGREYYNLREELDPRGTIIEMAKTALREITNSEDILYAEHELEEVEKQADLIRDRMDKIENEEGEITLDLIYVLRDALNLRQEMEKVHDAEAAVDSHISSHVDMMIEDAAFARLENETS